jgi:(1->4)-alpha-D-glucan 1-alpha-D-glucosylmutase
MEELKQEATRSLPRIPVSTYRLQFNYQFRFSDAAKIIGYLHELGISEIYASPYLKAQRGSLHGYDIVDPTMLNPEVGSEDDYNILMGELKKYDMGQVLDIVPNHMSIGSDNPWWMDVLENGLSSPRAKYFDIDWAPEEERLKDRLLIAVLGDQYGAVLENQELKLSFEEGAFFINYNSNKLPVQPNSYALILQHRIESLEKKPPDEAPHLTELLSIITSIKHLPSHTEPDEERIAERLREKEIIKKRLFKLYSDIPEIKDHIDTNVKIFNGSKGDPKSFDLLDGLLNEQIWRLSHWRVAMEEINYRRFFDINDMAGLKMENYEVFAETHKLIFKLISEGKVTGLRVDHADGLYNPQAYLRILQQACFTHWRPPFPKSQGLDLSGPGSSIIESYTAKQDEETPQYRPFYIVVEKILTKNEKMPQEWPIFGTTGYGFLNSLNSIFVATKNAVLFDRIYSQFIRDKINFFQVAYEKKKLVLQVAMSGEIHTLGNYISRITGKDRHSRDYTVVSLTKALTEIAAFFPVYRTYINTLTATDRDRQYLEQAVSKAKKQNPAVSASIYDFLKAVLLLKFPDDFSEDDKKYWLDFTMRFQQLTAHVMAKGLEDTAFFIYNRLVSLNDVGGSPDRFGAALEAFHRQNLDRIKSWPHTLIATSTHDTKHDEDVRARINVLSEMPHEWKKCLIRWSGLNKNKKKIIEGQAVPDRNEEYLMYQNIIGAWPLGPMTGPGYEIFTDRIKTYMLKAIREAKINSSWISPDSIYEEAVMAFLDAILSDKKKNSFLQEFKVFQKTVSYYGVFNSLSQTLLKIASPGIPDFYQGTEIMEFSLVDPDNRRPVNYSERIEMLEQLKKRESEIGPPALARELISENMDGRIKLFLMCKALGYRYNNHLLFMQGAYIPVESAGPGKDHVCSFARSKGDKAVLVIVPRFVSGLTHSINEAPLGEKIWGETRIIITREISFDSFRDVFTGEKVIVSRQNGERMLYMSEVLKHFPFAMLVGHRHEQNTKNG